MKMFMDGPNFSVQCSVFRVQGFGDPVKIAPLVFYEEFNGLKLRVTGCGLRIERVR
jgi:hypothetical protein